MLGGARPGEVAALRPGLVVAEASAVLGVDDMRSLMALLPGRRTETEAAARRLRVSNEESARLANWSDPALPHVLGAGEAAMAEAFYRFGPQAVLDRAAIEAASGAPGDLAGLASRAAQWVRPKFPLGGHDALAAGLSGPKVGARLAALEEDWIASGFTLNRSVLVAQLKSPG